MDKDGSGTLSVQECRGVYEKLGIPSKFIKDEFVRRKIAEDDTNSDDVLSYEEFMDIANQS